MKTDKESKREAFPIIIVIAFFLILFAPWLFFLSGFSEVLLYGEFAKAEKPAYSVQATISGEYQNSLNTWFDQNFPMNTRLIQLYSQGKFSSFRVSSASDLTIGKDDYFFGNANYIKTELGMGQPDDLQIQLGEYAKTLRSIQDKCDLLEKPFVYVISPNKAHIYPEYIPNRFYIAAASQPDKVYYHELLKQALEDAGVRHLDANEFLLPYKDDYQLFAKTGVHWNYIAAALVGEELVANPDYKMNLPIFSMSGVNEVEEQVHPDADLYLLSNLFLPIKNNQYYYPAFEKAKRTEDIYVFMSGSSFSEELGRVLIDANVINDVKLIQYARMFYYYSQERTASEVWDNLAGIDYKVVINSCDVFIFSNLPSGHNEEIHLTATNINSALEEIVSAGS